MEIQHSEATVNGVRLHYAHAGEGPLMLFCHGFPEFWYTWRRQLEEFGRDHLAVAPDMRGYNLSDKPAGVEAYRIAEIIADIRGLAEHFGDERFVLVGHDWGGAACWAYAMAHPETLDGLVIANAPHPAAFARELASNPEQAEASQYMRLFRQDDAEATLSANDFEWLWKFSLKPLHDRGLMSDADRAAYLAAWGQPGALTGGLNWYRATSLRPPKSGGGDDDGPPALDPAQFQVKVPTLVAWGMEDRALRPGLLDGLEAFVPDLRVERLPGVSHWVTHEASDRLNALIRAFLAELPR